MSLGLIVILIAVALAALIGGFLFSMLVISKRADEDATTAFNKAFNDYTSKGKP